MSLNNENEKEVNIITDIFGLGEIASSASDTVNNTVDNANIKGFPIGLRFFIVIMLFTLIAIIIIPLLHIDAFKSFPFGTVLCCWFMFMFLYGGLFCTIEFLKSGHDKKRKKKHS